MKKAKSKSNSNLKFLRKRVVLGKLRKPNTPKNTSDYIIQNYMNSNLQETHFYESSFCFNESWISYNFFGGTMLGLIDCNNEDNYQFDDSVLNENDITSSSTCGSNCDDF